MSFGDSAGSKMGSVTEILPEVYPSWMRQPNWGPPVRAMIKPSTTLFGRALYATPIAWVLSEWVFTRPRAGERIIRKAVVGSTE